MFNLLTLQAALLGNHEAVNFQNGTFGVVQQGLDLGVQRAVLREQLSHVLRTAARCGLVGLRTHPFHQVRLEERPHPHQHAAHGAVTPHPVVATLHQGFLNHGQVDGVQNDDRIVLHAQGGGRVNPVTLPSRLAQFGKHL